MRSPEGPCAVPSTEASSVLRAAGLLTAAGEPVGVPVGVAAPSRSSLSAMVLHGEVSSEQQG